MSARMPSARTQPSEAIRNAVTLRTMTHENLDAVMAIEQAAYSHPWSRGNFQDSLNPLFDAQCLWLGDELLGYFLAMHGVKKCICSTSPWRLPTRARVGVT